MVSSMKLVSVSIGRAIVAFCLTAPAIASAQDCYRPAECDGQEVCVGNVCVASEEPLTACDEANLCANGFAICDDGFCKIDAVYCENPAGRGEEDNAWGNYNCETGEESSWEAGEPPVETLTDQELFDRCLENLVAFCGEDAPDINAECTPEQLESCQEYFDKLNQLLVGCGEEPMEVAFMALKSCCNDLEEGHEEAKDQIDCVMELAPEDCAERDDCFDVDGEDTGSDADSDSDSDADAETDSDLDTDTNEDSDSDANAEADNGSGNAGGCSLAPAVDSAPSLFGMLQRSL